MIKVCAVVLALCALQLVSAAPPAAALDVLSAELPPPPRHRAVQEVQHASLLAVATEAHSQSQAALEALAQAQMALAVDDAAIESADISMHVTAAGQLSADEQALVERQVAIPSPPEPAKPVEYMAPPTRDLLATDLGPEGYKLPDMLDNALSTVSSATESRIDQLRRQTQWTKAATKLVRELNLKKSKVAAHVSKLSQQIRGLLGKKKQIQNKQLQDKLVARLEQTHNNLKKIRRQSHNIKKHQADMIQQKEELANALEGIKRSLALLKGMKRDRQFPSKGVGAAMKDRLSKFDPDLSFEKEAQEVRQLRFPDAVLLDESSGNDAE